MKNILLIFIIISNFSVATAMESKRQFDVELLVFSQSNKTKELMPVIVNPIKLPKNYHYLNKFITPNEDTTNQEELDKDTPNDEITDSQFDFEIDSNTNILDYEQENKIKDESLNSNINIPIDTHIADEGKDIIQENPPIIVIKKNMWNLSQSHQKLEKDNEYKVLFHSAWQQKIDKAKESIPVYFNSENYLNKFADKDNMFAEVEGMINFKEKGFLEAKINIIVRKEINRVEKFLDKKLKAHEFKLTASNKIKFKKIYYFDHPEFGALLTVQPSKIIS